MAQRKIWSGCGWISNGRIHGCFTSQGATPRAAVKLTSGWWISFVGIRHFLSGGKRLCEREFAGQLQIGVASDDLHLEFREIKFLQRWKNLREPRPVQVGGKPVGFRNGDTSY